VVKELKQPGIILFHIQEGAGLPVLLVYAYSDAA
jgi:hypothetical protein